MPQHLFLTKVIPTRLELLLHFVSEHDSSDSGLQGVHDEVYASSGIAWDTANLFVENGIARVRQDGVKSVHKDLTGTPEGKHYEDGRPPFPILVHVFDLEQAPVFPRNCNVELYVVEEDNARLGSAFKKYDGLYRAKLEEAVDKAGKSIFEKLGNIVGGKVGGEIGVEIGKEAGKFIKNTLGSLINAISKGLADDVMMPFRFSIDIPDRNFEFGNTASSLDRVSGGLQTLDYKYDGAHYVITYEWVLHRRFELLVSPGPLFPRNSMSNGGTLQNGQKLVSKNGKYALSFQANSGLSLFKTENNQFLWSSGTGGSGESRCIMQKDGNLVIYTADGTPVWDSGTFGGCYEGAKLILQDDANLVIYAKNGKAVWDTGTFDERPGLNPRPAARPCN